MACYVATLRQSYLNQLCINRFSYVSTVEPVGVNGSNVLATLMGGSPLTDFQFPDGTLIQEIQGIVNPQVSFLELEVMNLFDEADFFTIPFPAGVVGEYEGGTPVTPTLAYGFYSNRITRAIRRGYKRFVGVDELAMGAGGVIVSPIAGDLVTLGSLLSSTLNPDNVDAHGVFTPSVFQYKEYTTPRGKKAYKPWPTEGEQLAHAAIGVTFQPYEYVRTQNSRQYGRGA